MSNARHPIRRTLLALGFLFAIAGAAEAGPPLICHAFDAGSSALLPWGQGQGWDTPDRSYDVHRLTADTVRLLTADAPILARMENSPARDDLRGARPTGRRRAHDCAHETHGGKRRIA